MPAMGILIAPSTTVARSMLSFHLSKFITRKPALVEKSLYSIGPGLYINP